MKTSVKLGDGELIQQRILYAVGICSQGSSKCRPASSSLLSRIQVNVNLRLELHLVSELMKPLAVFESMFTSYFDEYQKQFSEYQKQISDWQKKFFDVWLENLPSPQGEVNFSEAFDKALKLQEELVRSHLEVQEKSTKMMLDAQRKFWDDYFVALRKQSDKTAKAA
jgi:hypothetical protein